MPVDNAPVCYVVAVALPGDAIFVPYSAMVCCGGYLPSDISGFQVVEAVPKSGGVQIHLFEFHVRPKEQDDPVGLCTPSTTFQ